MRPTLAAEELKRNLTQYLTTTFAPADWPARESPTLSTSPGRDALTITWHGSPSPFLPSAR